MTNPNRVANKHIDEPVPFVDLYAQHMELHSELHQALDDLLNSSGFILGPQVSKFEEDLAAYLGDVMAIGCASGTEALNLAAEVLDLGPGDEVITVANTWISTVFAISQRGATPVFVDVDPDTGQMCPDMALQAITPRTKAIFAVHLFGKMAPVDQLAPICKQRGIALVEDAAQALGSKLHGQHAGTFGDLACFSFYPGKNLGGLGDGGAIVAADKGVGERLRRLINYGQEGRHNHVEMGHNSRLDELQAAVLNIELKRIDKWNAIRRDLGARYRTALDALPPRPMSEVEGCDSNNHLFVVQTERRDDCLEWLQNLGVMAQVHYPVPVHLQPCYANLGLARGSLPVTEQLADTILSLPMSPHLRPEQLDRVVQSLRSFFP